MTEQEIFYMSATGLLKQGIRSEDRHGSCVYRSPEGLKCAAGFCIKDEEYIPSMEKASISTLLTAFSLPELKGHAGLLSQLQNIHDCNLPEYWKLCLVKLAEERNLSTEAIDNL